MKRVLFVCLGNICRSPTADGVMRALVARAGLTKSVEVDSAGTSATHAGEPPDPRTQAAARARGYELAGLRSRQVVAEDFVRFDLILAMDKQNLANLRRLCPPHLQAKVALFLQPVPGVAEDEVPDPYYGGAEGFAQVLDLVEAGCQYWLAQLQPH
ncbi:low molecular weight protein-tyrosine-phosphatase [Balneatrix alpica]|uniref:protein-tyrosine-phosphatase n=1 Tax=Balneatrix alpica TaxID=75684 RepID=A0ABV5Z8I1_9GAMM|nr:low molecular weight protein-tyrosine-phosphatase [Balneatrix alpica]